MKFSAFLCFLNFSMFNFFFSSFEKVLNVQILVVVLWNNESAHHGDTKFDANQFILCYCYPFFFFL